MIKFSRRTVLLLLVLLILVSIIIRYPNVEHERQQTDSYFIHLLSSSIVDDGRAEWVFNPLSLFGYYPLSYPSGMPFLLASLSSMTGLTIETGILLCNYLLAIAFCLGVFALSRQFVSRTDLAILAKFFAVLGSRFVDTTYWNGSARGLVVVFMVLLLFAVFQSRFRGQHRRYALIVVILCIGCLVAHHMAILLVVFAIGYILATILNIVLQATSTALRRSVVTFAFLTTCVIAAIMTYSVFVSLWNPVISNFRSTSLFEMDSVIASVILNMAMSYVNQIGLILPVAILGIPIIISGRRPTTDTLFLIVLPIVFIPLLGNAVYVSMLLAPIIAILGIMTISYIVKDGRWSRKMQLFMIFLITFLVRSSSLVGRQMELQSLCQRGCRRGRKSDIQRCLISLFPARRWLATVKRQSDVPPAGGDIRRRLHRFRYTLGALRRCPQGRCRLEHYLVSQSISHQPVQMV